MQVVKCSVMTLNRWITDTNLQYEFKKSSILTAQCLGFLVRLVKPKSKEDKMNIFELAQCLFPTWVSDCIQ